ncbi:MAG: hypothetical protein JXB14_07945 [Candidatus Altiarchaeota archaeon]|nr:hypothetical protein [Candidatus Altiarchaeota archaeon]
MQLVNIALTGRHKTAPGSKMMFTHGFLWRRKPVEITQHGLYSDICKPEYGSGGVLSTQHLRDTNLLLIADSKMLDGHNLLKNDKEYLAQIRRLNQQSRIIPIGYDTPLAQLAKRLHNPEVELTPEEARELKLFSRRIKEILRR